MKTCTWRNSVATWLRTRRLPSRSLWQLLTRPLAVWMIEGGEVKSDGVLLSWHSMGDVVLDEIALQNLLRLCFRSQLIGNKKAVGRFTRGRSWRNLPDIQANALRMVAQPVVQTVLVG